MLRASWSLPRRRVLRARAPTASRRARDVAPRERLGSGQWHAVRPHRHTSLADFRRDLLERGTREPEARRARPRPDRLQARGPAVPRPDRGRDRGPVEPREARRARAGGSRRRDERHLRAADGPQAGQTVPPFTCVLLACRRLRRNDDIYREVEASGERDGERSANAHGHATRDATRETQKTKGRRFDPDAERVARSAAEMAAEAAELRPLF